MFKKFIIASASFLLLFLILFARPVSPSSASGYCVCQTHTPGRSATCDMDIPAHCGSFDTPKCNIVTIISGAMCGNPSCTCLTPTPLPPGIPVPTPACGQRGQPCCVNYPQCEPGFGLFCISTPIYPDFRCRTREDCQSWPGGCPISLKALIFCDANGNPSNIASDRVYTALGCLSTDAPQTVSQLLDLLTKLSGGFALLLIIVAALQIVFAGGNPARVQAGKELISAVVAGLVLLALSVVILNFAGVNILGLQNLGFRT